MDWTGITAAFVYEHKVAYIYGVHEQSFAPEELCRYHNVNIMALREPFRFAAAVPERPITPSEKRKQELKRHFLLIELVYLLSGKSVYIKVNRRRGLLQQIENLSIHMHQFKKPEDTATAQTPQQGTTGVPKGQSNTSSIVIPPDSSAATENHQPTSVTLDPRSLKRNATTIQALPVNLDKERKSSDLLSQ